MTYADPVNDGGMPSAGQVIRSKQADDEITDIELEHSAEVTQAAQIAALPTLAGDLGGTPAFPQVIKLQGTALAAPSGTTTTYLNGQGQWTVPPGVFGVPTTVVSAAGTVTGVAGHSYSVTVPGVTITVPVAAGSSIQVFNKIPTAGATVACSSADGTTVFFTAATGNTTTYTLANPGDSMTFVADGSTIGVI